MGSFGAPGNITRAPDNTPFGPSVGGVITSVFVQPTINRVQWQANVATDVSSPINRTVDTVGAPVGSFSLTWARPISGQYDAAMTAGNMLSSYNIAPYTIFDTFIPAGNQIGVGVSTTISAVPEPGAMTLVGLVALLGSGRSWFRRRR